MKRHISVDFLEKVNFNHHYHYHAQCIPLIEEKVNFNINAKAFRFPLPWSQMMGSATKAKSFSSKIVYNFCSPSLYFYLMLYGHVDSFCFISFFSAASQVIFGLHLLFSFFYIFLIKKMTKVFFCLWNIWSDTSSYLLIILFGYCFSFEANAILPLDFNTHNIWSLKHSKKGS